MPDREKVIKGFECCHVMVHDMGPDQSSCGICPYKDAQTQEQIDLGGIECIAVLHDDALALLKEQEAVVRCKDCKHYDKKTGRCALRHVHGCAETWFCADGERKKGR